MDTTPDDTLLDPQEVIADLRRQLAERTAEHDGALARETVDAHASIEAALRLSEERYRTLVTATSQLVWATDAQGKAAHDLESWQAFTGQSTTEILGDGWLTALHPDDRGRTTEIWAKAVEMRALYETEYRLRRRDGAYRHMAVRGVPILAPGGTIREWIGTCTDITERKETDLALREALEQQTATADVLQVINSSAFDLRRVFDTLVERAAKLCAADMAMIFRPDGDRARLEASYGFPPAYEAFLREVYLPEHSGRQPRASITGRTFEEARVIHIRDVAVDPEFDIPEAISLGKMRTALGVPLMRDGIAIGVIALSRQRVEPFTGRQIELVRTFAEQAVIAIENTRLITETREALEQQTATAEVLQVINSSPGELAPVFNAMLEKAMWLCEVAFGWLDIFDGARFKTAAVRGLPDQFATFRTQNPPDYGPGTAPARILAGERIVHIADLTETEAYQGGEPNRRAVADLGRARTALIVPLLKDKDLLGFISVFRQEVRPFSEKQIALVENFAQQAVIAMENARLLGELRQRTEEIAELNRALEARVAEQVEELGRVGRLKRFLAPQLAELIVSQGDEKILESHRREIVVVFCDLRGYTAFTETAEPEEVLDFLREYHGALGPLVSQFEGTLDQFSGDGIMVFFNDPVPCPDPAERAVKMAIAMREAAGTLISDWRERGRDLGFGVGIAQGYATLGQIGFSERAGYTAIGTVCNVAARLCAEAKDCQILLSQRVNVALKGHIATEQIGALALKGLNQPVVAYNVPFAASRPALQVIEGGAEGF